MATLRASSAVEENPAKDAKVGAKAGNLLAQGSKRRSVAQRCSQRRAADVPAAC